MTDDTTRRDRDALAEVLRDEIKRLTITPVFLGAPTGFGATEFDMASAILASDWLADRAADVAAQARRDALEEHGSRDWQPGDADTRCQRCGHKYEPWFTDNWLWNRVVGGSGTGYDPGGYLCSRCFAIQAGDIWPNLVWRFVPEWSPCALADPSSTEEPL